MRRWLLVLGFLGGCATGHTGARPVASRYTVDVSSIPEGYNCFPVVGDHREQCAWRLKSAVGELMSRMLDRALAEEGGAGWRAKLELLDVHYQLSKTVVDRADKLVAAYRFTLTDPTGKQVVAISERVTKGWNDLVDSTLRGPFQDDQEQPEAHDVVGVGNDVYYLLRDIAGHLGQVVAGALGESVAVR